MAKAPIYDQNDDCVDQDLLVQLCDAIEDLKTSMVPSCEIKKGHCPVGFGVKKAQRSIAADTVISIVRQIKARPGW